MADQWKPPGNQAPGDVYAQLQAIADAGHIKLTKAWCSELGYYDVSDPGHFHGQGSIHLPVAFVMTPDPGEGVTCQMPPPIVFKLPLPNLDRRED